MSKARPRFWRALWQTFCAVHYNDSPDISDIRAISLRSMSLLSMALTGLFCAVSVSLSSPALSASKAGSGLFLPTASHNTPNTPSLMPVHLLDMPALAQNQTLSPSSQDGKDSIEGQSNGPDQSKSVAILSRPNASILGPLRPFLLHSKDATITYLMPGAILNHPQLGQALRSELESRALSFWQDARKIKRSVKSSDNIPFILRSRVEDRFQSERYSSLFWQEERQRGKDKGALTHSSLAYDHLLQKPIGLKAFLGQEDDNSYNALLALLTAYIRVDIARQKSLRLGSSVSPDQDAWLKDLQPSPGLLSTFTLTPSNEAGLIAGLTFHFNPGLLGAEADGAYSVYVPSSIFATSLQDSYAVNFGGEALKVSNFASKGLSSAMVHLRDIKEGDELAGSMVIEGEVPSNWCNGFHVTLLDGNEIVSEGGVTLEPNLPGFGLVNDMIRFRVDMDIKGQGGKVGQLVFEPYQVDQENGRAILKNQHACDESRALALPSPLKDQISVSIMY